MHSSLAPPPCKENTHSQINIDRYVYSRLQYLSWCKTGEQLFSQVPLRVPHWLSRSQLRCTHDSRTEKGNRRNLRASAGRKVGERLNRQPWRMCARLPHALVHITNTHVVSRLCPPTPNTHTAHRTPQDTHKPSRTRMHVCARISSEKHIFAMFVSRCAVPSRPGVPGHHDQER